MKRYIALGLSLLMVIFVYDVFAKKPKKEEVYLIKGYDGIEFGMTFEEVVQHLAKIDEVLKDKNGNPQFERVPTKPYYRYWINRSKNRKTSQSEVTVWFKDWKVVQLRDVFGGERLNKTESAIKVFEEKKKELIKKWGVPTRDEKDLVTWVRDDGLAILRLIRPNNPYAYPVLKLVVSAMGNATDEILRTIRGTF